ncbi:MAG: AAA family ATPase, partial [Candidatus Methanomethylophilaceae archaeon]|nr:AAA family ATPase [Candidatus Methanomethylophilaceae archaeon]
MHDDGMQRGLPQLPLVGCNVYLKQVELENFKSFGGKLVVPLMEGYTAVTGPNGSGKSN